VLSNYRKTFNEARLKELADNIAKVGVLQPVILRADEANRLVLVAGERRYRAAKIAGLKTIPYRQLVLSHLEAREVMALENLHRADLNPVEEAQAFKMLIDSGGYTVADVAARVDKSKDYVYRAVALLDLPEAALSALAEGKITAGHARQILRVPEKKAPPLLKMALDGVGVKELAYQVRRVCGHALEFAEFPKDTAFAGMPPCKGCAYNSESQSFLFPEEAEAGEGQCTNPACYLAKGKQKAKDDAQKIMDKKYPGMVNLGGTNSYMCGDTVNGKPVVQGDLAKKVAKEIKASPQKFGVVFGRYSSEPTIVINDKELADKYFVKEDANLNSEQSKFVREYVRGKIMPEAIKAAKRIEVAKETIIAAINRHGGDFNDGDFFKAVFGVKNTEPKELKKLSEKELVKLLVFIDRETYDYHDLASFCLGAVRHDEMYDRAKDEALKAWKERQKKSK
jgi:ParB/RepB/Spo0J family partition protein